MKIAKYLLFFFFMPIFGVDSNPAFYAVKQKNIFLLTRILRTNPESITSNQDGQTILHAAVFAKNESAVDIICKSELININQLDKQGKTALDYAVEHGYNKIVRILYKMNAKVTSAQNGKDAKKIITRPFRILFYLGLALPVLGLSLAVLMYSFILLIELVVTLILLPFIIILALCGSNLGPLIIPVDMPFFNIMFIGGITTAAIGGLFIVIGASGWANRSKRDLFLEESY